MQNVELRHLPLSPRYRAHLLKAQYTTAAEVLLTPPHVLRQRLNLPPHELDLVVAQLSTAALDQPESQCRTLAQLAREPLLAQGRISLGDRRLDEVFGGGIRVGTLTEIAGQSASGKTHLCLQLALQVQLAPAQGGLAGGALYISSEGTLPSSRLLELAYHLAERSRRGEPGAGGRDRTAWDFLDNVQTEKSPDVETLEAVLSYYAPAAIERTNALAESQTVDPDLVALTRPLADRLVDLPSSSSSSSSSATSRSAFEHRTTLPRPPLPVKLVILDSIAAPLRPAHAPGSTGFVERSKELARIGDTLKRIANVYRCAVVVVNQVTDVFDDRDGNLPRHLVENPSNFVRAPPPRRPRSSSSSTDASRSFDASSSPSSSLHPLDASSTTIDPLPPSRSTTSFGESHHHNRALDPPHVQYSFPLDLYGRFQTPHTSGAVASSRVGRGVGRGGSGSISAALGTSWTNQVNTRVLTRILPYSVEVDDEDDEADDDDNERDSRDGRGRGEQGMVGRSIETLSKVGTAKATTTRTKTTKTGSSSRARECVVVFGPEAARSRVEYVLSERRGVVSCGPVRYREPTVARVDEAVGEEEEEEEERRRRRRPLGGWEGHGSNDEDGVWAREGARDLDVEMHDDEGSEGSGATEDDDTMWTSEWERVASTLERGA
ncbi:hypothetical protein JCM10212_000617 [Sporobolomyces blumeae]